MNAADTSNHPAAVRPLSAAPTLRDGVRRLVTDAPYAHVIVPTVTFLLIAACAVWLWHWQSARELEDVRHDTALIAPAAADRFEIIVKDDLRPLTRFSRELGNGTIASEPQFVESVSAVQAVVPSLKTVVWVDPAGVVQAVAPRANRAEVPLSVVDAREW